MSIHIYTGVPGSGKSLHAASDIRFVMNRRTPRPVIANFPLGKDAPVPDRSVYTYLPNEDMSARKIMQLADDFWTSSPETFREDYILLVIDECQLLFNARTWTQRDRLQYLEFLSQSRKYGVKVLLIAQATKMIDNQFRMLIEVEHNHRRISSMGLAGALIALPFNGRLFHVKRSLYQLNEDLGIDIFHGLKADLLMYDSYATFEQSD